jgi:hypothetical protein
MKARLDEWDADHAVPKDFADESLAAGLVREREDRVGVRVVDEL